MTWDEYQLAVIEAPPTSRITVEGGPGTGKTAVACARVAYLIEEGVDPANIWLVSFTRTAVREIRNRINELVEEEYSAGAVRISTIDSHAWHLRQGFDYAETQELFGSYDANILSIIQMLTKGHEGLIEYLSPLQHLIVDEAQDLVGNRSQLLFELILRLPHKCGITVFTDSAQAIYGFADDEIYKSPPLKDRILKEASLYFNEMSLSRIHRTDSEGLKTIFRDVRDFVLDDSVSGKNKYVIVYDSIKECADSVLEEIPLDRIRNNKSTLILFRRRAEVFLYSQHLSKNNIAHRIRTGGLSPYLPMWLGQVFGNYQKNTIDETQFKLLWDRKVGKDSNQEGFDSHGAWNILLSLCGDKRRRLNVEHMKTLISRSQVPIELSIHEAGQHGPVLSTIHASKGREADNVYIAKGHIYNNLPDRIDEETRVLFVAATRAKKHLYFFEGPDDGSCITSKYDSRIINITHTHDSLYSAGIEFWPREDLDHLSFVETDDKLIGSIRVIYRQVKAVSWFSKNQDIIFHKPGNNFERYKIYLILDNGIKIYLGKCSSKLNDRIIRAIKETFGYLEEIRLPKTIKLKCIGGQTVTTSEYLPESPSSPYGVSGIFVMPVFSNFMEFNIITSTDHRIEIGYDDEYEEYDVISDDVEELLREPAADVQ